MRMALQCATANRKRGNAGVAALLEKDGEILAVGANLGEELRNPLRHAELEALDAAIDRHGLDRVRGSTCYTTMEPCPMCASALIQAGIRRIVLGGRHVDVFPGRYGDYKIEMAIKASGVPMDLLTDVLRQACADVRREVTPAAKTAVQKMPRHFDDGSAWTVETLCESDWRFGLDGACVDEIRAAARFLDRNPIPIEALTADDLDLPHCREVVSHARHALRYGSRFAVIDRIPLDEISEPAAKCLYWVLMSTIARPVAQKHDGSMCFTVHDTGRKPLSGSGVRPAVSNVEQHFHNDNAFNGAPPDYVSLLCVRPAASGGVSRVVSLATVHNELAARYPAALERLYGSFCFDRQKEHLPDEPAYIEQPIFHYEDSGLRVRLTPALVHAGYAVKGVPMDDAAVDALDRLVEVANSSALYFEFLLERGQIQIVNNHETGHARTAFDDAGSEHPRKLERLWLRDGGKRTYSG
jgi:tRNA(Arg) A34 adenosine deaminase TadA/alpha-ketoglutarate-dependent taurine dioxygenase